jgi:hypothetical protein
MTDDLDFIDSLLKSGSSEQVTEHWPAPPQVGPLRRYEKTMSCVSTATSRDKHRTCRSPTYYKLYGIPTCMIHALFVMNERLAQYENEQAAL